MKKFTKEHEWLAIDGDVATIGITEYAAKELGDITFVELPEVDDETTSGDVLTVVESVKAATDVFAPVTGTITEANEELEDSPQLINESAEEEGWICKVQLSDASQVEGLMTAEQYQEFLNTL